MGCSQSDSSERRLKFVNHGIPLSFFTEFIKKHGRLALQGLTTAEVHTKFVMIRTINEKKSYCELIPSLSNCVASCYVIHSWDDKFLEVVDAITRHFADEPETLIWFDLFSKNFHYKCEFEFDYKYLEFLSIFSNFEHTVAVISSWKNLPVLHNTNCLL